MFVIENEVKQSRTAPDWDCHVTPFLAMTQSGTVGLAAALRAWQ